MPYKDPEMHLLSAQQWYWNHREQALAAGKRWRDSHKTEHRAMIEKWCEDNPTAGPARVRNRRARLRQSLGTHTAADIARIFAAQDGLCFYCGEPLESYHVDHMTPLSRGGSNDPSNLCCACPTCNRVKGAKTASEFIERMHR